MSETTPETIPEPVPSQAEDLEQAREAGQELFQNYVNIQKAKYGPDWKDELSEEMATRMAPVLKAFLPKQGPAAKPQK
jgi:hypothetical protein